VSIGHFASHVHTDTDVYSFPEWSVSLVIIHKYLHSHICLKLVTFTCMYSWYFHWF